MANAEVKDLTNTPAVVRNCYVLLLANSVWLLIPVFGLVTGNNLNIILAGLVAAGTVLFLTNNYIGKRWYYYSGAAKNSAYESHFDNIDNIGFVVFFVTMISALAFLIATVIILNIFKSQSGYYLFLVVDVAMSALLIGLAIWVVKHASGGLAKAAKGESYKYAKFLNLF